MQDEFWVELRTFFLSDCLEKQRPQSRPCLHCCDVSGSCSVMEFSPIPSSKNRSCSSHMHCTHGLVGDILVTATNYRWGKVMAGAGKTIWVEDFIQQLTFFSFFLCELPASKVDLSPDELVTHKVSCSAVLSRLVSQASWCVRKVHSPAKNPQGETACPGLVLVCGLV